MTNKKFSKIVLYPVVYDKNTNGSFILDNNGNKIILKDYPYVFSSDSYNIVHKRYEYTSRPSIYITTTNISDIINEGITVQYSLYSQNADDGDQYKISILGNFSTNDIDLTPSNGIVTIQNKKAVFTIKFNSNDIIENNKSLYLQVKNLEETFTYLNYGPITLVNNDFAPTYSLTGDLTLYEDEANTYTLTTQYVNTGTPFTVELIKDGTNFTTHDYVLSTKQITINNNTATFTISGVEDNLTEGTERFYIQILNSENNPVALFGPVQVIDTSQGIITSSNYILDNFIGTSIYSLSQDQDELNFKFGNDIKASSKINFSFLLNYLNGVRQEIELPTLTPTNNQLTGYNLIAFLCSEVNTDNTFNIINQYTYSLNNSYSNKINQYSVELNDTFSQITHEYLLDIMTENELQQFFKTYKIIFRIVPKAQVSEYENVQHLIDGDIVQNINIFLDASKQGQHEVDFEVFDMVDPNIFSLNQRKEIYTNHINLFGYEGIRLFYPSNISTMQNVPVVFICHGMSQYPENYDAYASMFASYGYFCASIWYDVNGDVLMNGQNSDLLRGLVLLQIIDHLKKNISTIDNKFANLNFNNLILMGHSRGGGTCLAAHDFLYQKDINSSNMLSVLNTTLNLSDIKCLIPLAFEKNCYLLPENSVPPETYCFNCGDFGGIDDFYLVHLDDMVKYNIPYISVVPTIDNDTDTQDSFLFKYVNKDINNNVITPKQVLFVNQQSHDYIGANYFTKSFFGYSSVDSEIKIKNKFSIEYDTQVYKSLNFKSYNSQMLIIGKIVEKILYFMSNNYLNYNKNILESSIDENLNIKNNYIESYQHELTNKIYYIVDDYSTNKSNLSITSTSHLRAPCIDKNIFNLILNSNAFENTNDGSEGPTPEQQVITFNQLLTDGSVAIQTEFGGYWQFGYPTIYENNNYEIILGQPIIDQFNGVLYGDRYGLSYTFDETQGSNFKIEYSYSDTNTLSIFNKSFININIGQNVNFLINNVTDQTNIHFDLELLDIHGNTSILNSKQYKESGLVDNAKTGQNTSNAILSNIKFRIQDFKYKNFNLDLNQIEKIILRFGSNHGSGTKGQIVIDSITILN